MKYHTVLKYFLKFSPLLVLIHSSQAFSGGDLPHECHFGIPVESSNINQLESDVKSIQSSFPALPPRAVAGFAAAVVPSVALQPLNTTIKRMQLGMEITLPRTKDAVKNLYRGFVPNTSASLLYRGTQLHTYEHLKEEKGLMPHEAGAVASTVSNLVATPLWNAQASMIANNYTFKQFVRHAARNPRILAAGTIPGILDGSVGIFSFPIYEKTKAATDSSFLAGVTSRISVFPMTYGLELFSVRKAGGQTYSQAFNELSKQGLKMISKAATPALARSSIGSGLTFLTFTKTHEALKDLEPETSSAEATKNKQE